jgi:hypothetical protein
MKKFLMLSVLYTLLGCISFYVGFCNPKSGVVFLEGEYNDCFFEKNPLMGIPLFELYMVKKVLDVNRCAAAKSRVTYVLDTYYKALSLATQKSPELRNERNFHYMEEIKEILDKDPWKPMILRFNGKGFTIEQ